MNQKIYHIKKKICHHQKFFNFKNIFKGALQYLFNVFLPFNIVYFLKLNFKLKIDPKMCNFKNLEEIYNPEKFLKKTSGNPANHCGGILDFLL